MEYATLDVRATGKRIKELRKARHLRVEDIAEYMGFESVQAVYKWQRGESLPTVDNLYALSKLFGTSVDSILVGGKKEDESPLFHFLLGCFAFPLYFLLGTVLRCYYILIFYFIVSVYLAGDFVDTIWVQ